MAFEAFWHVSTNIPPSHHLWNTCTQTTCNEQRLSHWYHYQHSFEHNARQLEQEVCNALHGFWLVECAGVRGHDRQAYWVWWSGERWVGVCTLSVTRSTVHTKADSTRWNTTNSCISESLLVYYLKIPPAINHALHCNSSVARCYVLIHRTYFCDLSIVSWSVNITALITPKQHSSSVDKYTLTNSTYCQASCKTRFQKGYPSTLWYQVYM